MTANVNAYCAQLAGQDASKQAAAAEALARLGGEARPAAAALARACDSSDESVREWCVAALEELGPPPPGQIQELIGLARGSSPEPAYWAVTLIGRAGDHAAPAVAALADIVRNSTDPSVRQRAAWALGKIGPVASPAQSALREAASGDEPRLARLAKQALEAFGG